MGEVCASEKILKLYAFVFLSESRRKHCSGLSQQTQFSARYSGLWHCARGLCVVGMARCGVVRRLRNKNGEQIDATYRGGGLERVVHKNVATLVLVEWWRWRSPTPQAFTSFARLSDTPRIYKSNVWNINGTHAASYKMLSRMTH